MNNELSNQPEQKYFSWYPGHIAKAEKDLKSNWLPLVDIVIELIDARVPVTSRYQDRELFGNKPIITVFNKADIANIELLKKKSCFCINSHKPHQWKKVLDKQILETGKDILEKLKTQGRKRKLRLGICGMPNVGKSSFLNAVAGMGKKAKTGNLPGVTRQMQFITGKDYDLLDSPGICPVKILQKDAFKLAVCELLPAKLFDEEDLAKELLELLQELSDEFNEYKLENNQDFHKLVRQFRDGKFGKICLD